MILGGPASGGFLGISVTSKPNPFGINTCNIYAEFDRPGEDHMLAVTGTAFAPLTIQVIGGTFYQNPFGTDLAPLTDFVNIFASLAFDSFVTIGVKQQGSPGQPTNDTILAPGWPGFGPSTLTTSQGGWVVIPVAPQGDPFDPVNSFPGDGRILIGQFSTTNGTSIEGSMRLQYISNGVTEQTYIGFCHDVSLGLCPVCPGDCGDFDSNVGIVDFLALLVEWDLTGTPCDIDGGGVGITDFLKLLANWGPCLPQPPDSCNAFNGMSSTGDGCQWDCCDGDGNIGVLDLLNLFLQWGGPGSCDFNGGGTVDVGDLLKLLNNWGPCP